MEIWRTFKEPGTGLVMAAQLWYLISDAGSSYCSEGFKTSQAAVEWAISNKIVEEPEEVYISDPASALDVGGLVNAVLSDQLLAFWIHDRLFDLEISES